MSRACLFGAQISDISNQESKAPRSELMDELN